MEAADPAVHHPQAPEMQYVVQGQQVPYLPVYKSIPCISRPPILEPKNKFFSHFWVRIFLKNQSHILEFSFRYVIVTRKQSQQVWT